MNYKAKYFDGKSTVASEVDISIASSGIVIRRKNLDSDFINAESITWDFDNVKSIEAHHKKYLIKYGQEFPFQTLETDSEEFISELKKHQVGAKHLQNPYSFFKDQGSKGLLIALSIIAGFLALFYFVLIPLIMDFAADVFPRDAEIAIGEQLKENFIQNEHIDSARTVNINKFYSNLKVNTDYKINITVVKSEVKNAFALPGGEIVVFGAILDSMTSYSELVALLGHEVGHIEKRHTLKMIFKNLSNYIIISAVFSDISGVLAVIVQNATMIEQLSYNREVEGESDEFGFEVLVNNKVNPEGMVMLFEQLKDDKHSGGEVPEFLLTHPKLDNRIETVKEKIKTSHYSLAHNDSLEYYFGKIKSNW